MAIYDASNVSIIGRIKEYNIYINTHKANVLKAFEEYGEQICEILKLDPYVISLLAQEHDKSKFSLEEFAAYRKKFYPAPGEVTSDAEFDRAWLHHIHNNPHHWEYWMLYEGSDKDYKVLDIPDDYLAEMVLDWAAMSYVKGGDPKEFYQSKKDNIVLSFETRRKLETILNKLF